MEKFHNDFFRDYYDFVFDKDGFNIYETFFIDTGEIFTPGFAAGTVADRAFDRLIEQYPQTEVVLGIAPSVWMRRIGIKRYAQAIISLLEKMRTHHILFEIRIFRIRRPDISQDYLDLFEKITDYSHNQFTDYVNPKECGRLKQLVVKEEVQIIGHPLWQVVINKFWQPASSDLYLVADGSIVAYDGY
ncbi:MAG: hypothetical protein NC924_09920, partial [Candidatus Omnitrophica bacterium]|nr:hypothetical protein [Candidatus Omnitrophota bacterium]